MLHLLDLVATFAQKRGSQIDRVLRSSAAMRYYGSIVKNYLPNSEISLDFREGLSGMAQFDCFRVFTREDMFLGVFVLSGRCFRADVPIADAMSKRKKKNKGKS